jgi:hypothetical protein
MKGLEKSHAYSILKAIEVDSTKFVQLRNPWGYGNWNGKYNNNDESWTIELKEKLNFEDNSDGIFWMLYEDFIQIFNQVYICRLIPEDFKTISIQGQWDSSNSGGSFYGPGII